MWEPTSPTGAHLVSEIASLDMASNKSDLNLLLRLLMRAFPSSTPTQWSFSEM